MKTVNIRVSDSVWYDFKTLAKLNNSDASKEIRKFLELYLKNKGFVSI